jgi:hypothetical protein
MAKIASCDHYPGNAIFRNRKGQALEIDDKKADPNPLFWVFGIELNVQETQGKRQSQVSCAKR